MNLTLEQIEQLQAACALAFSTMRFAIDRWPAFAAWAEQITGETWTQADLELTIRQAEMIALLADLPVPRKD